MRAARGWSAARARAFCSSGLTIRRDKPAISRPRPRRSRASRAYDTSSPGCRSRREPARPRARGLLAREPRSCPRPANAAKSTAQGITAGRLLEPAVSARSSRGSRRSGTRVRVAPRSRRFSRPVNRGRGTLAVQCPPSAYSSATSPRTSKIQGTSSRRDALAAIEGGNGRACVHQARRPPRPRRRRTLGHVVARSRDAGSTVVSHRNPAQPARPPSHAPARGHRSWPSPRFSNEITVSRHPCRPDRSHTAAPAGARAAR